MHLFFCRRHGKENSNISILYNLHCQWGHPNAQAMAELIRNNGVTGLKDISINDINNVIKFECESCSLGKGHRQPFTEKSKTNTI